MAKIRYINDDHKEFQKDFDVLCRTRQRWQVWSDFVCRTFVCNQPLPEMERNKIRFHTVNKVVFMRTEFFGNTEDIDWYRKTIGQLMP